ncbi:MAG: hypothetical protein Q9160_002770 [Pyrenula sp. 1 TL-2023]
MRGIQALFALIGAAFVLGAIWFFFWAKNGGFHWRKNDWEEYKSTVLRRKGPDGRTLSNATKSTRLGGGSVVGRGYSDQDDQSTALGMSEVASTVPEKVSKVKNKLKNKARRNKPGETYTESPKAAKQRAQRQEKWEGGADDDVRAYRHEKPARVGGLNKVSDGVYFGSEYDTATNDGSAAPGYDYHQYNGSGSRHASRQSSPHKQQQRASNRDFSYTAGTEETFSTVSDNSQRPLRHSYQQQHRSSRQSSPVKGSAHGARRGERMMPGGYADMYPDLRSESSSDTGTKSYHHPIPGLSGGAGGAGRNNRGGFRRGGGGLSDDEL